MKVALASYPTVMMRHGGPRTQIVQTCAHLRLLGVDAEIIDFHEVGFQPKDWDVFHLLSASLGTLDLATFLNEQKVPFVVSPIFFTQRSFSFVRLSTSYSKLHKKFFRGSWTSFGIVQEICTMATKVLPNTEEEKNLMHDGFSIPLGKMRVVPNGVEERFAYATPDLFHKSHGVRDFILNVGHIGRERKNVYKMLVALRGIQKPIVLIGNPTHSDERTLILEEAKKNKALLIIEGLDHSSELLASAYAAANTFVLPSQFETPGIAALEAGLAGAKIVITPHGGTKEYFGDHATYVDPFSISSIREGVESSLSKDKTDTLKNHIHKHFLWKNIIPELANIYKEITNT